MGRKVVRLTESDLSKIVKRVIKEDIEFSDEGSHFREADDYAAMLWDELDNELTELFADILNSIDLESIIGKYQNMYEEKYGLDYVNKDLFPEAIDDLMNLTSDYDETETTRDMSAVIIDNLVRK